MGKEREGATFVCRLCVSAGGKKGQAGETCEKENKRVSPFCRKDFNCAWEGSGYLTAAHHLRFQVTIGEPHSTTERITKVGEVWLPNS